MPDSCERCGGSGSIRSFQTNPALGVPCPLCGGGVLSANDLAYSDQKHFRKLLAADRRYRASLAKTESLRIARNDLLREHVGSGDTPSEIARALGVTRARVAQILEKP